MVTSHQEEPELPSVYRGELPDRQEEFVVVNAVTGEDHVVKIDIEADRFNPITGLLPKDVKLLTTNFTVDDSYSRGVFLGRKLDPLTNKRIILSTRQRYKDIFKTFPDGQIITCSAWDGDDLPKEEREITYRVFGFGAPNSRGKMTGVIKNGKIMPIDPDKVLDYIRGQ